MLFIDENSGIDKAALRQYTASELEKILTQVERLVYGTENQKFWDGLQAAIVLDYQGDKKESLLKVWSQLKNLNHFVRGWRETAVDSDERMEFFIQSKAVEIKSGDEKKDYFWALQIRHDQLIALVKVVSDLVGWFEKWVKMPPAEVVKDESFQSLTRQSVEDQVYKEAEAIHLQRDKMTR